MKKLRRRIALFKLKHELKSLKDTEDLADATEAFLMGDEGVL